jgi:ParB-like chromosome segregation protein Spo0J
MVAALSDVQPVAIGDINIGERHRTDLGDIDGLAASIIDVGLLQPIVLTPELRLVAGRRRLAAMQALGEAEVPAYIVHGLDDAAALLRAERDENTCRKAMTASELHAIGKALEALERPKAAERQQATQAKPGEQVGS